MSQHPCYFATLFYIIPARLIGHRQINSCFLGMGMMGKLGAGQCNIKVAERGNGCAHKCLSFCSDTLLAHVNHDMRG